MNTFQLDIMTPEQQFFTGAVEALTVDASDGELTVLAGHAPLVASLSVGNIRLKQNGEWKEAFSSEGFVEVQKQGVVVYVQACEWPENIDVVRARESKRRAEERIRQHRSMHEYKGTQIALARAMARLRVTHQKMDMD
ncbi:MAG: ATP synthase F1 subunit epsilon [Christensenellales bacterium]|jgi:F-type H+-transporting ATPase subunit epsilon